MSTVNDDAAGRKRRNVTCKTEDYFLLIFFMLICIPYCIELFFTMNRLSIQKSSYEDFNRSKMFHCNVVCVRILSKTLFFAQCGMLNSWYTARVITYISNLSTYDTYPFKYL